MPDQENPLFLPILSSLSLRQSDSFSGITARIKFLYWLHFPAASLRLSLSARRKKKKHQHQQQDSHPCKIPHSIHSRPAKHSHSRIQNKSSSFRAEFLLLPGRVFPDISPSFFVHEASFTDSSASPATQVSDFSASRRSTMRLLFYSCPLLVLLVAAGCNAQLLAPLMSLAGGLASNLNPFQGIASSLTGGVGSGGSGLRGGLLSSLRGAASNGIGFSALPGSVRNMPLVPAPVAPPHLPPFAGFGNHL
jgi:hypothetical protein